MTWMELWNNLKLLTANLTRYHKRPRLLRYGIPLLLIGIAIGIKLLFINFLGDDTPFLLMVFIILLSALYGGFGPGIMTTVLGGLIIDFLFLHPLYSVFTSENIIRILIYFIEGLLITLIIEAKQQTDKQKDDFIGLASHEIKNPLTAIQTFAGLIEKKTSSDIAKYAKQIRQSSLIISQLLSELMDLATIESGRLVYHDEKFKIYDLVKMNIDIQSLNSSHKIVFTGKTDKKVNADKTKISEVVKNLISNAIKYSPQAKQIKVHIKNVSNGIVLSVQDFGMGISENAQSKIFEKYVREEKAVKSGIKGLGIGLYFSLQIVKKYKGKLWLKSRPGKGSTFYLFLKTL